VVSQNNVVHKFKQFKDRPLAYFCAEYALFDHTPFYKGGLGILAGDYVMEMVEEKFPVVAFGLLYHREHYHGTDLHEESKNPEDLGLSLLKNKDGSILKVPIKTDTHILYVQAWLWKKEHTTLYLLDTQLAENTPEDWAITDYLYVEDRYLRLLQEIVLGVGGMKILEKLNVNPLVYHLNEGHSAFMIFELIEKEMKENKTGFLDACKTAKEKVVFTNHTLVDAGQEFFDPKIIEKIFGIEYMKLGLDTKGNNFSLTKLALDMSRKVNAVSAIHEKMAKQVWGNYNIESVTNGIHIPRWDEIKYYSHKEQKRKLINLIQENCGLIFDENILLIGWARRFVDYKRPTAILGDVERLKKLAQIEGKELRIVFSSPLNETYREENKFIKEIERLMKNELKGIIALIPNYDISISKLMVSGCDIWLNTPIVGCEACGTSGMKACLNGVLPLSTSDGWVDEVNFAQIGWIVRDGEDITKNLLDTLETDILPEYYGHKDHWKKRMTLSRELIQQKFGTERMLNDYINKMYL
jgi:starch phosphorylase